MLPTVPLVAGSRAGMLREEHRGLSKRSRQDGEISVRRGAHYYALTAGRIRLLTAGRDLWSCRHGQVRKLLGTRAGLAARAASRRRNPKVASTGFEPLRQDK